MAFFDSGSSRFFIDDARGAARDLSAFVTRVSGLPGTRALTEVTALSDSARTFVPGAEDASIHIRGVFDGSRASGPDAVLGALRTHRAAVDFTYAPRGTAKGAVKYSGKCWVENYQVTSEAGRRVEFSARLKVDGNVERSAF